MMYALGTESHVDLVLSLAKGILNEVWKNKLIFVETPDANETSIALENYRRVGDDPGRTLLRQTHCPSTLGL
jgi:hypothetical protein